MKRLIVNADDLGRTHGINTGVFEAHRLGIVTSSTAMVNYDSVREAAAMSRENPKLGIGLHIALTGGRTALPPASVPSLVESIAAKAALHGAIPCRLKHEPAEGALSMALDLYRSRKAARS